VGCWAVIDMGGGEKWEVGFNSTLGGTEVGLLNCKGVGFDCSCGIGCPTCCGDST
jgi:hypothetical protein